MKPSLSEDGEGGTYFLRDNKNTKIACFKPSDEEAGCINNPRGRIDPQQAMHCGIKPSEGHLREIAAYLIDNDINNQNSTGFHAVPPTMRVEIAYNGFNYNHINDDDEIPSISTTTTTETKLKIGALQKFIKGEVVENFGVKNFAIREVHKIGILDIRILNCDRNSGNVLVSRDEFGRYELIPIDHGLSLPEKIEITRDSWVWLNWDQSKQPFDPYTLEFINNIDIEKDIKHLKSELNFPQITFENMRISHLVLKKCSNMGLTLHEIGSIIARPDFDTKSILEELMTQAEILAIEKFRQNKHLINRIRLKRRKSVERKRNRNRKHQKQQEEMKKDDGDTHIAQKFFDKGIPLKMPLIGTNNGRYSNAMPYVPSLAPPNARITKSNGVHSRSFQVLNTSRDTNNHHYNNGNIMFPSSPAVPISSTGSNNKYGNLSPNPSILHSSQSLGSGAISFTPEPFILHSNNNNNNHRPKTLIVHKLSPNNLIAMNKTESNTSTDYDNDGDKTFEIPFWTPNYKAQSSTTMSQQSSNPNFPRSVTPDRGISHTKRNRNRSRSPQMMPPFRLETHTVSPKPLSKARISTDEQDLITTITTTGTKISTSIGSNNTATTDSASDDKDEQTQQTQTAAIFSPLQLEYRMEKTSSIHGREGESILNNKEDENVEMNTIFKSISAASTAESDSLNDDRTTSTTNDDDGTDEDDRDIQSIDVKIFKEVDIKPQLHLLNDDCIADDDNDNELIVTQFNLNDKTINETEDNYDTMYDNTPKPFSSLNIDTLTPNNTNKQASITTPNSNVPTAEMVPLSRSTSCIDVRNSSKNGAKSKSNTNLMTSATNQSSNPLHSSSSSQQRISKDEDSLFLYKDLNPEDIKSASLINHSSMLDKRKEMLALTSDDSNGSNNNKSNDLPSRSYSEISVPPSALNGSNNNKSNDIPSRSYSEISVPPSALTSFNLDTNNNSPSIADRLSASPNNNTNNSVHTPSNKSQDDMINVKDHEFMIHPIMERMAKENEEVKKWFMYYLDQLLGIQCERISNQSRKNDGKDNIYDIDTVNGSFIWKNELRKHWIRSRLERKRLMQQTAVLPKNPFEEQIEFIKKPILTDSKTNPVRKKPISQNPWANNNDNSESDSDGGDWYGDDRSNTGNDQQKQPLENHPTANYIDHANPVSDGEQHNNWFDIDQPNIDSDGDNEVEEDDGDDDDDEQTESD
eukprot:CAMPEP_0201594062 /NCGR_PEP_ID=MMETSP0190_2-20130828/191493_1 /ASSEMBLY_ACC=CAM_ASM_000263 /TAXON_ID=37353 /ORGANISM="Rosalina sp." /LENGTH=1200 /DNA_ID=CAMNT_0048053527 /DNA_START=693 /DNA_END=4295 /DNA_ORIENTATION=+